MFNKRIEPLEGTRYLWVTNSGAAEITLNSILTLIDVAPDVEINITVGCLDEATVAYFRENLPSLLLLKMYELPDWLGFTRVQVEGEYSDYGSICFRDVSFARYFALMELMKREDAPILYIDGDIAFLRDPRPYLTKAAASPGASVLIQSDLPLRPETKHDEEGKVIPGPKAWTNHCTGLTCWSDAARTRQICQRVLEGRDPEIEDTHDQKVLNALPKEFLSDFVSLPEELFLNGSYLFEYSGEFKYPDDVIQQRIDKACMVHANWMIGMAKKTAAIKKLGMWRVGGEVQIREMCMQE